MSCSACQANVTKCVAKLNGVDNVDVNLLSGTMSASFDEDVISENEIINAVNGIGYVASLYKNNADKASASPWEERKRQSLEADKSLKVRLIASVCLLLPLMYVSMGGMLSLPLPSAFENSVFSAVTQMLFAIMVMFINRKFFIGGFKGLIKGAPNMDTLVAIGSGSSFVFSLYVLFSMILGRTAHHLYFESAAMILTLVTVGKFLESRSKSKTSGALEKLVNLAPKTAVILRDGIETAVLSEEIKVGDIVVIKPGDVVPVDGVITEGHGIIDQSAVTGESLPVEKNTGDTVISATKNTNGLFYFKAERVGVDTTLSQIINLVDDASSSKAPIARIADKVSGIFVPVVIGISVITAVVWMILTKDFEFALTNAVSVLVISCPCALGLATPVAIMVGTGKAANLGILVKTAESLEKLHKIDAVIFDKTGTLTEGKPGVTDTYVCDENLPQKEILKLAASLESGSNHPFAAALIKAYGEGALLPINNFENIEGRGVSGLIDGKTYLVGNAALMKENDVSVDDKTASVISGWQADGKTALYFAQNGKILAAFALSDKIRDSSVVAVKALNSMGISTVMLTGDSAATAKKVSEALNISETVSDILPQHKEKYLRRLQEGGKQVAMVGDGINDAPALARADVGIAIGAGTDIAIESADIVLIKDNPLDVANAILLGRAVMRNIKINLFWAFIYNVIGIPVAAGAFYGVSHILLSPMLASAAMSLSSLFVVTNALRLRRFKGMVIANQKKVEDKKMEKIMVIEGMMCEHCKANVEKTLLAVSGVSAVVVSLNNKTATVKTETEVADQTLIDAVTNAGYNVISCK